MRHAQPFCLKSLLQGVLVLLHAGVPGSNTDEVRGFDLALPLGRRLASANSKTKQGAPTSTSKHRKTYRK